MTDINLTEWLAGATVAEAAVEIYRDAALLGRIEEWQARYDRAGATLAVAEQGVGDDDPRAALEAEGQALLDELEASKSVWYVRALSSDDEAAINEAHPLPERPATFDEKPPFMQNRPTDAQAKAFLKAYEAWQVRREQFAKEHEAEAEAYVKTATAALVARGAEKVVRCLSRIEVGGGVIAESITLEQAQGLAAAIGEVQVGKILEAIGRATTAEPDLPAGAQVQQIGARWGVNGDQRRDPHQHQRVGVETGGV